MHHARDAERLAATLSTLDALRLSTSSTISTLTSERDNAILKLQALQLRLNQALETISELRQRQESSITFCEFSHGDHDPTERYTVNVPQIELPLPPNAIQRPNIYESDPANAMNSHVLLRQLAEISQDAQRNWSEREAELEMQVHVLLHRLDEAERWGDDYAEDEEEETAELGPPPDTPATETLSVRRHSHSHLYKSERLPETHHSQQSFNSQSNLNQHAHPPNTHHSRQFNELVQDDSSIHINEHDLLPTPQVSKNRDISFESDAGIHAPGVAAAGNASISSTDSSEDNTLDTEPMHRTRMPGGIPYEQIEKSDVLVQAYIQRLNQKLRDLESVQLLDSIVMSTHTTPPKSTRSESQPRPTSEMNTPNPLFLQKFTLNSPYPLARSKNVPETPVVFRTEPTTDLTKSNSASRPPTQGNLATPLLGLGAAFILEVPISSVSGAMTEKMSDCITEEQPIATRNNDFIGPLTSADTAMLELKLLRAKYERLLALLADSAQKALLIARETAIQ